MQENEVTSNTKPKLLIVAINVFVLVSYTVYFDMVATGELNFVMVAILNAIQCIICLITAIFIYRKEFLLSAALITLIGFSTCVMVIAG